jgi:hypothetical protein
MSRTFSTNSGSEERLKISARCGFSPKARQTRCTVAGDRPHAAAIERVLQCVAPSGMVSRVRTSSSATRSSVTVRGAPLRGPSRKPSSRCSAKRPRHLPTVWAQAPTSPATARLARPSAQRSTILARSAKSWAVLRRRTSRSSPPRSSGASVSGVAFPFGTARLPLCQPCRIMR